LTPTLDTVSYAIAGLPLGEHNITVVAFDVAGNSKSHTVVFSFVDTTNPTISSPEDISFDEGSTGEKINWTGNDLLPSEYVIYQDEVEVSSGLWNSSSDTISYSLDGLAAGSYTFKIVLTDTSGNSIEDSVNVVVDAITTDVTTTRSSTTATTSSNVTGTEGEPLTTEQIILIAGGAVVVLIGLICGTKKKR
jgi:hypothetical protein